MTEYHSLDDYLRRKGHEFDGLENMKQIAANQTSFTTLSTTGQVYTWGDTRYEACLGREANIETCCSSPFVVSKANLSHRPASEPHLLRDLADLPDDIEKISSGGYATAALTSANDVYFWGRPGQPEELLTKFPTPLDLDGQDILDVSVGFNHLMVLTTSRRLYVVGNGASGQLGMEIEQLNDWKEVKIPLEGERQLVGVHAGYKNSFVLIENGTIK